jgi:hypothetical protein
MDIKICISTTKTHSQKTLPVLIKSLLESGINKNDIYIFEGGNDRRTEGLYEDIKYIKTNHNSFDYTSLIEIVGHNIEADYWFLLHDTCRIGVLFKELLDKSVNQKLIPRNADKMSLKHGPSMNIGFYKYDYLMKHKDEIISFKGTGKSPQEIELTKKEHIAKEDYLFALTDSDTYLVIDATNPIQSFGRVDVYNSGTTRKVEYYSQLDLYKFKANWGQSSTPTINL